VSSDPVSPIGPEACPFVNAFGRCGLPSGHDGDCEPTVERAEFLKREVEGVNAYHRQPHPASIGHEGLRVTLWRYPTTGSATGWSEWSEAAPHLVERQRQEGWEVVEVAAVKSLAQLEKQREEAISALEVERRRTGRLRGVLDTAIAELGSTEVTDNHANLMEHASDFVEAAKAELASLDAGESEPADDGKTESICHGSPSPVGEREDCDDVCERIASTISGATWDEPRFGPVNMGELVGYVLHRAEQAGWRAPVPVEGERPEQIARAAIAAFVTGLRRNGLEIRRWPEVGTDRTPWLAAAETQAVKATVDALAGVVPSGPSGVQRCACETAECRDIDLKKTLIELGESRAERLTSLTEGDPNTIYHEHAEQRKEIERLEKEVTTWKTRLIDDNERLREGLRFSIEATDTYREMVDSLRAARSLSTDLLRKPPDELLAVTRRLFGWNSDGRVKEAFVGLADVLDRDSPSSLDEQSDDGRDCEFKLLFGKESWPGAGWVVPNGMPGEVNLIVPIEGKTPPLAQPPWPGIDTPHVAVTFVVADLLAALRVPPHAVGLTVEDRDDLELRILDVLENPPDAKSYPGESYTVPERLARALADRLGQRVKAKVEYTADGRPAFSAAQLAALPADLAGARRYMTSHQEPEGGWTVEDLMHDVESPGIEDPKYAALVLALSAVSGGPDDE